MKYILVIKHGALGDIFRAMGAFEAIRAHHPDATIVLLTESTYRGITEQCGYFDEVWIDNRQSWLNVPYVHRIKQLLNGGHFGRSFDRVYDLQSSGRTDKYFNYLLRSPKPEWVGRVKGCSHRRPYRDDDYHYYEGIQRQMAAAGIDVPDVPDISWLKGDISQLGLQQPYACLIPGCSIKNAIKRWSPAGYAELINWLSSKGIQSVLLGAGSDREIINSIKHQASPDALRLDLCDKSPFGVVASLARQAMFVIGSDTGPMHIAAMCCPLSIVLKTLQHDPAGKGSPVGANVHLLSAASLDQLSTSAVLDYLSSINLKGI